MTSVTRVLATCLAALATCAPAALAADTAAVAVNTVDESERYRLQFQIVRSQQDIVTTANAAVAVASCTDCQTVAAAFQVLLMMGEPDVAAPTNLAIAMNVQCTNCATLASAYQFALDTNGMARLTPEAQYAIAQLRVDLQRLRTAGLNIFEIQAELERIAQELEAVLATGLEPIGPPLAPSTDGAQGPDGETEPTGQGEAAVVEPATGEPPSQPAEAEPDAAAPEAPETTSTTGEEPAATGGEATPEGEGTATP